MAADGVLRFQDAAGITDIRTQEAMALLLQKGVLIGELPFSVAAVDLNDDGVEEWLFRQDTASNCAAQASCHFLIAGLSEKKPVLIGDISAAKITLADNDYYGVKMLAVYKNPTNDFDFTRYVWHPETGLFAPL